MNQHVLFWRDEPWRLINFSNHHLVAENAFPSCLFICHTLTLRYHYLRYPELFWQYLQFLWINIPPFLQQTVCGNILKVVFVSCLCNLWQTLLFCFYSFAIQVFVLSLGSMMVQGFFCSLMAFNMNSIV